MTKITEIRSKLASVSRWPVLRVFLAGLVFGPFLLGIMNGPDEYRPNLITEALGIGFTVLIIDWIYEQRARRELRRRLKREAGSRANAIAISAVEWIRAEGWLEGDDGLLKGANLINANLLRGRLAQGESARHKVD